MRSIPSPSIVTKRESTRYEASNSISTGQLRDCCLRNSYDVPLTPEQLFTNQVRTCIEMLSRKCSNVVLSFLYNPNVSFKLISSSSNFKLQSWHTSFACLWETWHTRIEFDELLYLSKCESFAMSRTRSCDLCETISNLLTVTMYLQNTLSRFHRSDLHKVDLRVHVTSASTRTLAFQKSQSCWIVSVQDNRVPGEHLYNLLLWSLVTNSIANFTGKLEWIFSVNSSQFNCQNIKYILRYISNKHILFLRIYLDIIFHFVS